MTRNVLLVATLGGALLMGCSPVQDMFSKAPPAAPYAASPSTASWTKPPAGYLKTGMNLDGAAIVGPPPTPDSPRGEADRGDLRGHPRAGRHAGLGQGHRRRRPIGARTASRASPARPACTISPQATPTLANLLLRMTDDAATLYQPAKAVFQRQRPPVGNTKPICVPREKWIETDGSYPSGHGLIGWSWALVISEVAPEHASAVLARGREFGDSRIVCGVHYPERHRGRDAIWARPWCRGCTRIRRSWRDLEKAKAEVAASKASGAPTGCPAG